MPVTLSTDDTTVSDLTLTDEYERALDEIGLTLDELWAIDRRALDVAFADEPMLAPLRRRVRRLGGDRLTGAAPRPDPPRPGRACRACLSHIYRPGGAPTRGVHVAGPCAAGRSNATVESRRSSMSVAHAREAGRAARHNQPAKPASTSASSAASAAMAVGCRSGGAGLDLGPRRDASEHQDAPGADRDGRRDVRARPSPIMIASLGSRPTARAASSSRYGWGLPIDVGVTPLAASIAATIDPAPGRTARSVG